MGTGSAFSLLPAQNASGNWIKIVQRVPVRIELDPKQLAEHPLRLGLSMSVDVSICDQDGKMLGDSAPESGKPLFSTRAYATQLSEANALIERIINDNLRSEEHTSELQSLMRISYAVFCLKQKKKT